MTAFRRFPIGLVLGACLAASMGVVLDGTPVTAAPTTWYVSSTGTNTGSNPCIITAPCQTVTEAVAQAATGDTVDVAGTIDDNVNISGAGPATLTVQQWPSMPAAVLDGQAKGVVLAQNVGGGTLTISGLTIQNGNGGSSSSGGGLYALGALVVTGSTITSNTAKGYSGIFAQDGLNMSNSVVSNNHGTAADGGGVGCNCTTASVTITSSTITGNAVPSTAPNQDGGGGLFMSAGTLTISDSTISGNTAGQGGGMYLNVASATLTDDAIVGNTATQFAGGVASTGGSLQLNDSTVASNVAPFGAGVFETFNGAVTIDGSTLSGNTGQQIQNSSGTATLAGDIVANDGASSPTDCALSGGATLVDGGYNVADDATCHFTAGGSTNSATAIDDYLGTLGNHGGSTETVPLLSSPSPSTAAADPAAAVIPAANVLCTENAGQDQRGAPRLPNGASACDIGAYEIGVPGAPTAPSATAGNATVAVSWTDPASDGGSAITGYDVYCSTSSPPATTGTPSATASGAHATQATVIGLTNGTPYFCVVTAVNGIGPSPASSPVVNATPGAPAPPVHGYWLVGTDGGIFSFGAAQFHGSTGSLRLNRPVVGITPTTSTRGYWLVATDGGLFAFGDAGYFGSIPGLGLLPAGSGGAGRHLNAPVVGMVPSVTGHGYFMVASDGGVFAFGDAMYEGSCPGIGGCAGAVVGVAPDANGKGYWLVTATGDVYTFGDARYFGAPGAQSSSITSIVRAPDGKGYWILDANGSVFAYGSAAYLGGLPAGASGGSDPATAVFTTSDGGGYWVATALGKVYPFGDAPPDGDMSSTRLNGSIIAATGF